MHDPLALGFVTAFMQSAAKTKDTRQIYVQQNFIDFHERIVLASDRQSDSK